MFKPLVDDGSHHDRERRARFMLTSSGRVVRIHGDPNAGSDLMVPTEHELKTILYDQASISLTGTDSLTHEREKIDYVALHAHRVPRRKGSKHALKNHSPTDRGGDENHRPCEWRQKRGNKLGLRVRQRDSSPRDGTGEEEEVSTFLDSFQSTCETGARNPALSLQTTDTSPSVFPTSLCQEPTSGRHMRETDYIVRHNTRDTLEMSKPLAQIDLYNILASAAPAEPGDAISHRARGGICNNGCPSAGSKKDSNKTTRGNNSTRSVRSVDTRGKRRASKALDTMPGNQIGGCLTRDPLGDEVAILQAKVQESVRRIERDVEKEKPTTSIDIARCYGTLLAERPRRLNDPSHLVKCRGDGGGGTKKGGTNDAGAILPLAVAMVKDGDDRTDGFLQGSRHLGCGRRDVTQERSRKARGKSTHSTGRSAKKMGSTCGSGAGTGISLGDVKWSLAEGEKAGKPATTRALKDIGDDFAGGHGVPSQQSPDGDDGLKSTSSDYGEESFESTDEAHENGDESPAAGARCAIPEDLVTRTCVRAKRNATINLHDDADESDAGTSGGRRYEPVCSRSRAMTEEKESRKRAAADAAALEIEACWRGFLGRRAAKWALRCVLLDVLRRLGGGKMSKKVASLADVGREDRRGLNRALRIATQSRHQLPPKEHISACVRFVKAFHRRRARAVEARKRRWDAGKKR
ncbi:unnamed protein product, partial [Scytosiphon promiscuus]